jgi:DNA-binding MarR family transcriptional regulator
MRKNNLIAHVSRLSEAANRFIVKELESHGIEGIVPSHGDILVLLFGEERVAMQEIAARIHRSKPTVTVLVNKLAELGYVAKEKSDSDSRVTYIALSEKGRALQPAFEAISARLNALVYYGLSDSEAEKLEQTLAAIRARFG